MNTCLAARGCTESRMDVLEARSRGWVMCALCSPQITPAGDTFCLCFPALNSLTHPVHQTPSFPLLPKSPVDLSAVTQAGHSQQCSLLFSVCKWSSHRIAKITLNNHLWQKWWPWAMAPSAKAQSISSKTSYGLFKLRKTRWNAASKPCGCNDCHSSIRSKGSQRESAKDWSFFPFGWIRPAALPTQVLRGDSGKYGVEEYLKISLALNPWGWIQWLVLLQVLWTEPRQCQEGRTSPSWNQQEHLYSKTCP